MLPIGLDQFEDRRRVCDQILPETNRIDPRVTLQALGHSRQVFAFQFVRRQVEFGNLNVAPETT